MRPSDYSGMACIVKQGLKAWMENDSIVEQHRPANPMTRIGVGIRLE